MLNASAAGGRVLYSSVRARASEGLGHAMATINADVAAAIRLGIAYSHRVGAHGSLTAADPRAVERFFGWGDGVPPRDEVSAACSRTVAERTPVECVPCTLRSPGPARWQSAGRTHTIERIVDLPVNLTYAFYTLTQDAREQELAAFKRRYALPNTLFQMPPTLCAKSPAQSYFANAARAYFYDRYWRRRRAAPAAPRLDDAELSIAVHARRGDFFVARRPMTTIASFGRAVRQILREVQGHGGPFAHMRVAVLVYSEGTPGGDGRWRDHDVSRMNRMFLDTSGTPRDVHWVRERIVGRHAHLFPNGVRVEMRIATETLQAAHEMIAADVFLGSMSGLSMHVVGTLSRAGVVGLPSGSREHWPGHCTYWPPTGHFQDLAALKKSWIDYAEKHRESAIRALEAGRLIRRR